MKKISAVTLIILIFFQFTSCSLGYYELPSGVWKSDSPEIVLYFDSAYRSSSSPSFLGIYTYNNETSKVFVFPFTPRSPEFEILPVTARRNNAIFADEAYFVGAFSVSDDRMRFTVGHGQHADLFTRIIFYRVEDYDPINPEEWFP